MSKGEVKVGQVELGMANNPADFQTAIEATKFGKFNVMLLCISIAGALTMQFETGVISFIIPMAACDLNLTSSQKGLLNSMAFLGMTTSGCFWGFLLDTLGRKKPLLIGFLIETLITVGKSFSPRVDLLCVLQFCGGTITGGLYIAVNTYLHEFHSTEYRGKIQMLYGSMFCFGNVIIPLLSSAVTTLNISYTIATIKLYSWNVLFLICATPSAITTICLYFLPETPKFLMSCNKNDEALTVLKHVYSANTGQDKELYPVKALIQEKEEINEASSKKSWLEYAKIGWKQIAPLFGKKHCLHLFLVCGIQALFQVTVNTFRLYMPQLFQAAHDYQVANNASASMCNILTVLRTPTAEKENDAVCLVNTENNFQVYLNSTIVATATMIAYLTAGTFINLLGKKNLLNILNVTAGITISCLYLSKNMTTTLVLGSLFFLSLSICFDIFVTIVVVIFPTTLRAMAFSFSLLIGRSLTVLGNMIVPMLVEMGCAPLLIAWSTLTISGFILSCFVPNTDKMDMK
ncbi:hypothetical protein GWI33_011722 [Rhynchophorus ferrugineus]|uniref:Major facilitator superfamily (MFS) profile domain-containing protein n=1 Tax=Rhynchophorus ferrugineus TaxID=354439 RepID=A0A834IRP0_RHYFE|nr:hypothetical protein GWI33_011722 [Rhynchophorus ferrugineus]